MNKTITNYKLINMKKFNINELSGRITHLLADDMLKMIYFDFAKEEKLPNHSHNVIAVLHIITGQALVIFDSGADYALKSGDILEFKASIIHSIEAKEDTKMLLTIASYSN